MRKCFLFTRHVLQVKNCYTPRRAVLYVPGNDERKLKKIPSLKADCVVMDCEDGVAHSQKVYFNFYFCRASRGVAVEFPSRPCPWRCGKKIM